MTLQTSLLKATSSSLTFCQATFSQLPPPTPFSGKEDLSFSCSGVSMLPTSYSNRSVAWKGLQFLPQPLLSIVRGYEETVSIPLLRSFNNPHGTHSPSCFLNHFNAFIICSGTCKFIQELAAIKEMSSSQPVCTWPVFKSQKIIICTLL